MSLFHTPTTLLFTFTIPFSTVYTGPFIADDTLPTEALIKPNKDIINVIAFVCLPLTKNIETIIPTITAPAAIAQNIGFVNIAIHAAIENVPVITLDKIETRTAPKMNIFKKSNIMFPIPYFSPFTLFCIFT